MEALVVPFLLFVGTLLALQAAANVQLSTAMASPFGASTLQLAIGAVLLVALATLAGSVGAFALLDEAEPWHLAGGLGSAIYITAGILLFPRLGALVAVGLFIAGQMLASLALDGFGWLGVARDGPGAPELAGAAAVITGAWLIVRALAGADTRLTRPFASDRGGSRWL
jgi:bacterial/archaeal transporter family-2 protein